ncbi:MAG: acyl-CoA dehydrogenase [Jatrophihabitans sp.]|nr:MAG: acyl-CoA dehydrogenase [Jatrophihabitans sp.]
MSFDLPESAADLAALARQVLQDQVTPQGLRAVEDTAGSRLDRALWATLADTGILAAALPESLGGGGLDLLEQCAVLVELGRAVAAVPYLEHVASAAAIGYFGTDAQRARWGVPAAGGSAVLTAALGEGLTATEQPATRAEPVAAGWLLTGTKAVVAHAIVADALLVSAATDRGVCLFVVLPEDPGVTLRPEVVIDGDVAATVELAGAELGADRLLPGADCAHWLAARLTVAHCARQVGVLERALELTAAHAREREQFGRPIGSFQAVAQRLADAYIDVDAARLTMWEAAWRVASGLPCPTEIATAKFWAAEAGHRVAHTAVHVHGGTGIDLDGPLHRYFVAAKRHEFALGGATAQLLQLGHTLAGSPA